MWLINCAFVGQKNFDIIGMHGTTIKIIYFLYQWSNPVCLFAQPVAILNKLFCLLLWRVAWIVLWRKGMMLAMQTAIPLCTTKLLPTVISSKSDSDAFKHQRNLANNIGGWGGGGGKASMVITNFNLRRSQVRKRGKVGLNRSFIYIHPAPLHLAQYFLFAPPPSVESDRKEN
jgi:hypothetical protein